MSLIEPLSERELPPPGTYQGVLVDVVDVGVTQPNPQYSPTHKVDLVWQIDELDSAGERFIVSRRFTFSTKSADKGLGGFLQTWGCRPSDADRKAGFDITSLVGRNGNLSIQHASTPTGNYANVVACTPLRRGDAELKAVGYKRRAKQPDRSTPFD